MILDGLPRLAKYKKEGKPPKWGSLGGVDPVEFILDKYAWMPTSHEKTRAIARCSLWLPPGRPTKVRRRAVESGSMSLMTAEEMAERAGVSVRTVVRLKKEIRVEQESQEQDLEWAQGRIVELEGQILEYQLAFQELVDRQMKPSQLSEALSAVNLRNRVLRDRLRSGSIALRGAKRTAKLLQRQLTRSERRSGQEAD